MLTEEESKKVIEIAQNKLVLVLNCPICNKPIKCSPSKRRKFKRCSEKCSKIWRKQNSKKNKETLIIKDYPILKKENEIMKIKLKDLTEAFDKQVLRNKELLDKLIKTEEGEVNF